MLPNEVEKYDVTNIVNAIIKGEKTNNGFILEPATTADLITQMQDHIFYSSEYSDVDKRPALVLYDEVGIKSKFIKTNYNVKVIRSSESNIMISANNEFKFSLFDLKGRELLKKRSLDKACSIDLKKFSQGIFLAKLKINNSYEEFMITF